ncbi:hypothetical protein bcere0027_15230 [Bacillus cereus AH676]|nr:hypothetical protein bcere0027_15230 [Bacillus cereus AH676]
MEKPKPVLACRIEATNIIHTKMNVIPKTALLFKCNISQTHLYFNINI